MTVKIYELDRIKKLFVDILQSENQTINEFYLNDKEREIVQILEKNDFLKIDTDPDSNRREGKIKFTNLGKSLSIAMSHQKAFDEAVKELHMH